MEQGETAAADLVTLTHRVARTTDHPIAERIFFNVLGRALMFEPATDAGQGAAQDVPACVAEAIIGDTGLAPHFRVEPISAEPTVDPSRRRRRESVDAPAA